LEFITILLISIGLAMDCFAVSLGIGCTPIQKDARTIFRITFHFGFFQGLMTFLGWLAGSSIASLIERFDHWIAFALLAWVGARMIRESFSNDEKENPCDPSGQDPRDAFFGHQH
jgi:putative Mn2+ efflux pump MntP